MRLNKELLESAGLKVGDKVEICMEGSALVIVPARRIRGKYSLESLVARISEDDQPERSRLGKAVRQRGIIYSGCLYLLIYRENLRSSKDTLPAGPMLMLVQPGAWLTSLGL